MDQSEKTVFVYENWRGEKPTLIGRLHLAVARGQEIFSFEYDDSWLNDSERAISDAIRHRQSRLYGRKTHRGSY